MNRAGFVDRRSGSSWSRIAVPGTSAGEAGMVIVPEDLVRRWEAAYQQYSTVARAAGSTVPGDPTTTRGMVLASRQVAVAWREIEQVPDLPWWLHAALAAAAQAFEFQARDWDARPDHSGPSASGISARPLMRLSTQSRRSLRREGGGIDE